MSVVQVRVPATTANLGPGFDCLGIALQIYNRVSVSKGGRGALPEGMMAQAGEAFFQTAKRKPFRFGVKIEGEVPRSRGMGSSVTVRLGILHGLNALAGQPLGGQALFELCSDLEGHPDNAAPAAFGGFTIAGKTALQRYAVSGKLRFVLLVPDFEVATPDARKALPKTLSLHDAVVSSANACAIAGAFASRDYSKLAGCFEDRLPQPYREKLVPFLTRTIRAGEAAGALGGWLSGSGSTIACMTLEKAEPVAEAMLGAARSEGSRVIVAKADNAGVSVNAVS